MIYDILALTNTSLEKGAVMVKKLLDIVKVLDSADREFLLRLAETLRDSRGGKETHKGGTLAA